MQHNKSRRGGGARPGAASNARVRAGSVPGALWVLLAALVIFSIGSRDFLTVSNGKNVLMQGTVLLLVSFGMGLSILSGGVDLSVGAVVGLTGVIVGILMRAGTGLLLSVAAGIVVSAGVGLINGFFISRLDVPPFVATFSTMGMAHGLALVISNEGSVWGIDARIRWLVDGHLLGLPLPLLVAALFSVGFWILMKFTAYGIGLYALGGNEEAARTSGVPVRSYRTLAYVISGGMAGAAAVMLIARMNSALPTAGLGYEWDAIAVAVVGGLIFGTGKGGVPGIVIGAVLIAVVRNGLNLLGIGIYLQVVVVGLIIIAAYIVEIIYREKED